MQTMIAYTNDLAIETASALWTIVAMAILDQLSIASIPPGV